MFKDTTVKGELKLSFYRLSVADCTRLTRWDVEILRYKLEMGSKVSTRPVNIKSAFHAVLIHRWVLWWFYVGIVCGAVALVNILFRNVTQAQERLILAVGIIFWLLGGLVCWASGGIRIEKPPQPQNQGLTNPAQMTEWHAASDFVLPGGGHAILPPSQGRRRHELLADYPLEHHTRTGGKQSAK